LNAKTIQRSLNLLLTMDSQLMHAHCITISPFLKGFSRPRLIVRDLVVLGLLASLASASALILAFAVCAAQVPDATPLEDFRRKKAPFPTDSAAATTRRAKSSTSKARQITASCALMPTSRGSRSVWSTSSSPSNNVGSLGGGESSITCGRRRTQRRQTRCCRASVI